VSRITTIGFDCTKPSTHFYGAEKVAPQRMQVLQREMDFVVNNMPAYAKFLKSKGCALRLISSINPAAKKS
jgi:hypothetical protein